MGQTLLSLVSSEQEYGFHLKNKKLLKVFKQGRNMVCMSPLCLSVGHHVILKIGRVRLFWQYSSISLVFNSNVNNLMSFAPLLFFIFSLQIQLMIVIKLLFGERMHEQLLL